MQLQDVTARVDVPTLRGHLNFFNRLGTIRANTTIVVAEKLMQKQMQAAADEKIIMEEAKARKMRHDAAKLIVEDTLSFKRSNPMMGKNLKFVPPLRSPVKSLAKTSKRKNKAAKKRMIVKSQGGATIVGQISEDRSVPNSSRKVCQGVGRRSPMNPLLGRSSSLPTVPTRQRKARVRANIPAQPSHPRPTSPLLPSRHTPIQTRKKTSQSSA